MPYAALNDSHIAKLLFDYTHSQGFPVVRVTVWETPTSFATYGGEASGA